MVTRRDALATGVGIITVVLPATSAAASGDDGTSGGLTVTSTFADNGSVTVSWTDEGGA